LYSIDGQTETYKLKADRKLTIETTPGAHEFQFYYSDLYEEVYADSLVIDDQFRDRYRVTFMRADMPIIMDKPVIYLYPDKSQEINIKLEAEGSNLFTYPSYENGWHVQADQDGNIHCNGKTLNYLFWEAEQQIEMKPEMMSEGFLVNSDETVKFLENRLTELGLTSKEQADFITFWAPRMMKNDQNFVHFVLNKNCDTYARINIEPRPDNFLRVYMMWTPYDGTMTITPQELKKIDRSGFTAIEWGGSEVKQSPQPLAKTH